MRERIVLTGFAVLLAAACAFHAAMSILFVLPPNPLGESVRPLVLAYTHPYFEQYWNMFAPTPIEGDLALYARTKRAGASDAAATGWGDVSAPLIAANKDDPFAPYSTLKNVQMMIAVAAEDDPNLNHVLRPADVAAIRDPERRPMIVEAMKRLALAVEPAGGDARDIQLSLITHEFPRFTRRADADETSRNTRRLIYPWLPIGKGIAR